MNIHPRKEENSMPTIQKRDILHLLIGVRSPLFLK